MSFLTKIEAKRLTASATNKPSPESLSPAQLSASWMLKAAADVQEAGCCATLALIYSRTTDCVQLAVDVPILLSSLALQLAFQQQSRLHLDEVSFIEKLLRHLVQRQVTAACKSVQVTVRAIHVVIPHL